MQKEHPLFQILEKLSGQGGERERLIDSIISLDEATPNHIRHAGFGYPGTPTPIIVQAPSNE